MTFFFKKFFLLPLTLLLSSGSLVFASACACSGPPTGKLILIYLNQKQTQNQKVLDNLRIIKSKISTDFIKKEKKGTRTKIKNKIKKLYNFQNQDVLNKYIKDDVSYCKIILSESDIQEKDSTKENDWIPRNWLTDKKNIEMSLKGYFKDYETQEVWSHVINLGKIDIVNEIINNDDFTYSFAPEITESNSQCK